MREIKFRVWEENIKQMFYNVGIVNDELYLMFDGVGFDVVGDYREFKLMQYTGLKGKNGKKIYEGDIVSYFGLKYEVLFKNGAFGWMEDGVFYSFNEMARSEFNKFEIIGNVYENPELLEGAV
ncbi:MAG: hypothetical protein GX072_13060 [Lysinibacillus sp.]|nr:hypothetical protein [Lysinibacillus sp.]